MPYLVKRRAMDGQHYSEDEFASHYGEKGEYMWECAGMETETRTWIEDAALTLDPAQSNDIAERWSNVLAETTSTTTEEPDNLARVPQPTAVPKRKPLALPKDQAIDAPTQSNVEQCPETFLLKQKKKPSS